jgi:IstB-like ATP binding protein
MTKESSMHDAERNVQSELKALRLNGMASAWVDLMEQDGGSTVQSSRWLIEHLLQAEEVDRQMRSIAHQMKAARFPNWWAWHRQDASGHCTGNLWLEPPRPSLCGSTQRWTWLTRWSMKKPKGFQDV